MGLWYKVSFISFIGNSLDYKNIKTGKNPFEAIQAKSVVIHGPKMVEPGYEKLANLGISEVVCNRHEIAKSIVKYSISEERQQKIRLGIKLLKQNSGIVYSLIGDLYEMHKKKGA